MFLYGLGVCTRNCANALMVPLSVEPERKFADLQRMQLSFCQEALYKSASCGWHIAKYYPARFFSPILVIVLGNLLNLM